MSENASIFLTGEILPGFLKEDVVPALARLLKTDERKAASLLIGRETLIKRNASLGDVDRYLAAFRKVGAVARTDLINTPSASTPPADKVNAPLSSPITPASTQTPQAHQGLALATAWSKPGEEAEQVTHPSGKSAVQAVGASTPPQEISPRATGGRATEVERDDDVYPPVYAEASVFGLSAQGRIGRLRYMAYFWPTMGLLTIAGILSALIAPKMAPASLGAGVITLVIVFGILLIWMTFRVMAMRLHDLNRSGKWVLLPIFISAMAGATNSPRVIAAASVLFWILSIALMLWPGAEEDNDYGPPAGPNTDLVYIGAAAYVAFWALGIVGVMKYGEYAKSRLPHASGEASNGVSQSMQADALMQNYAQQLNARTPVMISSMIKLDKVEYVDKVLQYKATIQGKGLIITDEKIASIKKSMLSAYCGQDKKATLFPEYKVATDFVFRYQVSTWDYDTFTIKFSPENCA
ncbi:MAG: DUF805 domain-containing protein [Burkholderiales bacterium]|nr:DUF805 domain-containing protein [Burkholderiales bacterium]